MAKLVFGVDDVGCYVDGAFGLDHTRQKLTELLSCVPQNSKVRRLIAELENEENLDYVYEAIDEAIDVLSQHTSEEVVWLLEAGDLLLVKEEELG